ncbi:MAG: hypothetical protein WDN04_02475 [Rhodospirillales bacterium]
MADLKGASLSGTEAGWEKGLEDHSLAHQPRRATLLTLLLGLALVQAAGLTIHALDRIGLQHEAELRNIGMRAMGIYRSVVADFGCRAAGGAEGARSGAWRHRFSWPTRRRWSRPS